MQPQTNFHYKWLTFLNFCSPALCLYLKISMSDVLLCFCLSQSGDDHHHLYRRLQSHHPELPVSCSSADRYHSAAGPHGSAPAAHQGHHTERHPQHHHCHPGTFRWDTTGGKERVGWMGVPLQRNIIIYSFYVPAISVCFTSFEWFWMLVMKLFDIYMRSSLVGVV